MIRVAGENVLGPAVVAGDVRYFSVSSLEKASTRDQGCLRKYHYRYVMRLSELDRVKNAAAKAKGEALHDEIAAYLRTGVPALSSLAMRGHHMLPAPGSDLLVERSMHSFEPVTKAINSPVTVAGKPLIGFLDLAHMRRTNVGSDEPDDALDPEGTVELCDWKFKSYDKDRDGFSTLLRPEQLPKSIQMAGCGVWARRALARQFGDPRLAERVRLSHGYFVEQGDRPRKVTRLVTIDECEKTWEYVDALGRSVLHVVREADPNRVDANVRACDEYGGCPYREICSAYAEQQMIGLMAGGEGLTMGMLDDVNQLEEAEKRKAALLEEEAQLRSQHVQPMAAHPLRNVWQAIVGKGRGYPGLGGNAARAFAAACGEELRGSGFAGAGALGKLTLFEVLGEGMTIAQLARELGIDVAALEAHVAAQAKPEPTPLPAPVFPVAAQAKPEPTPLPPPVFPVAEQPAPQGGPDPLGILPADTPLSRPELASAGPKPAAAPPVAPAEATPAAAAAPAETTKRRRGRPPGSGTAAAAQPVVTSSEATYEVYVDCAPNVHTTSLHEFVDAAASKLAATYCVDKEGKPTVQDIRCAPNDGPAGYGRGPAMLHALLRAAPPPPGAYSLDTRGGELAAAAADAMRIVVAERGGLYVRGTR